MITEAELIEIEQRARMLGDLSPELPKNWSCLTERERQEWFCLRRELQQAALFAIERLVAEVRSHMPAVRCAVCLGVGRMGGSGDYCGCPMGRDLARVEGRTRQLSGGAA